MDNDNNGFNTERNSNSPVDLLYKHMDGLVPGTPAAMALNDLVLDQMARDNISAAQEAQFKRVVLENQEGVGVVPVDLSLMGQIISDRIADRKASLPGYARERTTAATKLINARDSLTPLERSSFPGKTLVRLGDVFSRASAPPLPTTSVTK